MPSKQPRLGRAPRAKTGGRQKAKILAFVPRNIVEHDGAWSPGEEFQSWGPDLAWPAITASNWQPVHKGEFLGTVTLTIPHWRCRIVRCKVVRWGFRGLRVFLPEESWRAPITNNTRYIDLFVFLEDEDERDFSEAAIRAVKAMIRNGKADAKAEAVLASILKPSKKDKTRKWTAERIHRAGSWKAWKARRQRVFERDEFTCQDCGARPGSLVCSHLDCDGDDSDDNFVTRCSRCHALANAKFIAANKLAAPLAQARAGRRAGDDPPF